jgi:ABC-type transport system involved in multi-copper enzyme maturation permease subunit
MTTDVAPPRPVATSTTPAFVRLVRGEYLKIWTTNAWWLLAIGAFAMTAIALLINLVQAHQNLTFDPHAFPDNGSQTNDGGGGSGSEPPVAELRAAFDANFHSMLVKEVTNIYTSGQFFGLMFVMLLGVLIVTNEFHHQTATATFLGTPHRTNVIASKLVAGVTAGAALALVTMAIDVAVGSITLNAWGFDNPLGDADVLRGMGLNLLTYAIWSVIGVGLGVLIRSQIGATVTATVLYLPGTYLSFLAIFGIHYLIDKDWVFKAAVILPTLASGQLIDGHLDINGVFLPGRWVAGAVLIGWGLLFGLIGTLITRRRDIS